MANYSAKKMEILKGINNLTTLEGMQKNVFIDGLPIKALIDTGSYYTLITKDCANTLMLEPEPFYKDVGGLGTSTHIIGRLNVNIEIDQMTFINVECYVVSSMDKPQAIIGCDIITATPILIINPKTIYFNPKKDDIVIENLALHSTHVIDMKTKYEAICRAEMRTLIVKCSKKYISKGFREIIEKGNIQKISRKEGSFYKDRMTKIILLNDSPIEAYIDTGASISIIGESHIKDYLEGKEIQQHEFYINESIKSKGYITVKLEIDNILFHNIKLFVINTNFMSDKIIIGVDVIKQAWITINKNGIIFRRLNKKEI